MSRRRASSRSARRAAVGVALLTFSLLWGCLGPQIGTTRQRDVDPQAAAESVARGKTLYLDSCAPCHGQTGEGDGPLAAEYDPRPVNLVASGVQVSVKGIAVVIDTPHYSTRLMKARVTTGNREMPTWKDVLTEQQIDDVVAYVRFLIEQQAGG